VKPMSVRSSVGVDGTLMCAVRETPGLSLYELSTRLKWSIGKTDGSVRRLTNARRLLINAVERNGRLVTLVYPRQKQASDIVQVPKSLLKLGNPLWKDVGYVYALDYANIGITGEPSADWKKQGCHVEKAKLVSKKDRFVLRIPERIANFYHLSDKHVVKTVNGNRIILTIDGRVILNKRYSTSK